MDSLPLDLKFALRSLRKSPGLTLVAALSLAIGIGANTAIFSAVDVFMLRPLPYPESEDLVFAWTTNQERGWTSTSNSAPDFLDWRDQARTLDLAAFQGVGVNLTTEGTPVRLGGYRTSWNFFRVLGEQPVQGRGFLPEDERAGGDRVVILGHGVWVSHFGSDPQIIGRSVTLDGEPHTIIGVLRPRLQFGYSDGDVWLPLQLTGEELRRSHFLWTLGRIQGGATFDQANAEIAQIESQIALAYPESSGGNGARLVSLRDEWFDEGFRSGSLISTVAVLFVLLIACANVANLLLARGAGRETEIALRSALGAGRHRIVRQLFTESVLLALLGGIFGVGLAVVGIRGLVSIMPPFFLMVDQIGLHPRVLAFTAFVTLLAGLLFGLAPALQTAAPDLKGALHEGSRGSTGRGGGKVHRALVISQMALALVLLVSSGLLVQSFIVLRSVDLGFQPEQVLTMSLNLPQSRYDTNEEVVTFERDLLSRLESLQGAVRAGLTTALPTQGHSSTYYTLPEGERAPVVGFRNVTPGYFDAMRIPLRRGRMFTDQDDDSALRVILINESLAARHWEDSDPIGKVVEFSSGAREIVGVVGDVRVLGPSDDPPPMVYFSAFQEGSRQFSLALRSTGDPAAMIGSARDAVLAIDPDQPVFNSTTMEEVLKQATGGDTIMAKIMSALGLIALIMALVGVYGVMAYTVSRRLNEVGIRMALGADGPKVLRLVLGQGAFLAVVGVSIGFLVALGVTRGLSFFLFGVRPFDPAIFFGVSILLFTAGVAATYFPALRATRVDPIEALRSE